MRRLVGRILIFLGLIVAARVSAEVLKHAHDWSDWAKVTLADGRIYQERHCLLDNCTASESK